MNMERELFCITESVGSFTKKMECLYCKKECECVSGPIYEYWLDDNAGNPLNFGEKVHIFTCSSCGKPFPIIGEFEVFITEKKDE